MFDFGYTGPLHIFQKTPIRLKHIMFGNLKVRKGETLEVLEKRVSGIPKDLSKKLLNFLGLESITTKKHKI